MYVYTRSVALAVFQPRSQGFSPPTFKEKALGTRLAVFDIFPLNINRLSIFLWMFQVLISIFNAKQI